MKKARKGKADDLTRIAGIGPRIQAQLQELGIFHFDQIAQWTPDNVKWVDAYLRFNGRIPREAWVEQAGKYSAKEEQDAG
jgi:NADH-quinone oxidoreductase subunit E